MKTSTIIASVFAMAIMFSGFVFANPSEHDAHPEGGPPCLEGGPPPHPPEGRHPGMERGRPQGGHPWMKEGRSGKGHEEMWGKKNRDGKDMHGKMRAKISKMRKENPEEFKRLMKLRKEDPKAFKKEIHKRYKEQFKKDNPEAFKKMKEMKETHKKIKLLNQEYKKCEDADKKKEIKQQMKDLIGNAFDVTQEFREKEINNLEKKTKELRKKVRKRGKNKKEMVELRLKGLIDGEETVKW